MEGNYLEPKCDFLHRLEKNENLSHVHLKNSSCKSEYLVLLSSLNEGICNTQMWRQAFFENSTLKEAFTTFCETVLEEWEEIYSLEARHGDICEKTLYFNSSVCCLLICICLSQLILELKLFCGTLKCSSPLIVCRTEGLCVFKTGLATFWKQQSLCARKRDLYVIFRI